MLTQAEIDALLSGAIELEQTDVQDSVNLKELMDTPSDPNAKESPDSKQIRPYNFWSPDRFSKDQIRAVELVHEELAERLTNSLPTFLQTNLRPRIVHTEQGRFHDFLNDLPQTSLFHLISLAPLPGQMVVTISPEISYVILEQRLGGRSDRHVNKHSLTEIDQSLIQDLIENMLNDIKASWAKVVPIEPRLVDSTTNQHWVQMMVGNERVMMLAFELMLQQATGTMSFYIPFSMLKPVINELNPHTIITGRKEAVQDVQSRQNNLDNLSKVTLPIKVILGKTKLRIGDLVEMQPGDVILLDSNVHDDISVSVAGKTRFKGRVGKKVKNLALQITEFIDPHSNPLGK
jgi:flagellar motor switch protein FliM